MCARIYERSNFTCGRSRHRLPTRALGGSGTYAKAEHTENKQRRRKSQVPPQQKEWRKGTNDCAVKDNLVFTFHWRFICGNVTLKFPAPNLHPKLSLFLIVTSASLVMF